MKALSFLDVVLLDRPHLPRKPRRRSWLPGEFPVLVESVLLEPLLEGILEALSTEVFVKRAARVLVRVLPAAVAEVDLLVGIEHEEVDRVQSVEIEETDVDSLQLRDASTDILREKTLHTGWWATYNLHVERPTLGSLLSAELEEHRLAGDLGLL